MSELGKIRATNFFSVLAIALALLVGLNGDSRPGAAAGESIEVCAITKGALCDDATGQAVVTAAQRVTNAFSNAAPFPNASVPIAGDEDVASLGAMTVAARPWTAVRSIT